MVLNSIAAYPGSSSLSAGSFIPIFPDRSSLDHMAVLLLTESLLSLHGPALLRLMLQGVVAPWENVFARGSDGSAGDQAASFDFEYVKRCSRIRL